MPPWNWQRDFESSSACILDETGAFHSYVEHRIPHTFSPSPLSLRPPSQPATMISSVAARRSVVFASVARNQKNIVLRCVSTVPPMGKKDEEPKKDCREMHSTSRRSADAMAVEAPAVETVKTSSLADRFTSTLEVTISKIFPAGFGWQTASIVADGMGYEADTLNFALTTGFGDALGVLGGHMAYYGAKKAVTGADINMTSELHTGILLGSAAMCSGTVWQPLVNVLQGAK